MRIPVPVLAVIAAALDKRHSRADAEVILARAGIAETTNSQVGKARAFLQALQAANDDEQKDMHRCLGRTIEQLMEVRSSPWGAGPIDAWDEAREEVRAVLTEHGLEYQPGGHVTQLGVALPVATFKDHIQRRDLRSVEDEFAKAMAAVSAEPNDAAHRACSMVESVLRIYCEDNQIEMPKEQSIKPMWKLVRDHLGFDPSKLADDDLKKILTGLSSIVDGIGSLRTHESAHGGGRTRYRLDVRHARLAVAAAMTVALFVLETWDAREAPAT